MIEMLKKVNAIVEEFLRTRSLIRISYRVKSRDFIMLPPLSSNLLKAAVASSEDLRDIWEMYAESKRPRKVLYKALRLPGSGGRLIALEGKKGLLHMDPDKFYEAEIVLISDSNALMSYLPKPYVSVKTPYGEVELEVTTIDIIREVPASTAGSVRVRFLTPTILSKKIATPPWLSKRASALKDSYSLLPTPGLLAGSVLKNLLEHLGEIGKKDQRVPYMALRFFDLFVEEVDHELKPVTVLLGKDDKGNMRRGRGTIGWINYRAMNEGVARAFVRLLKIAEIVGVGKSRGIGLGEISLSLDS
ncbi:CRISPR system precrRNA processing endoribonuclease RAMP protein Cas6 [Fervidicoccus fontis]|uniref:CRISPR system precrRNA processing endoribonuclease RAMP protein Cas6 n=2 Tax=Fervidicoccus fontis TaxID=683846 RepID=A0A843A7N6_9CREN|nr:CRISPR system precrRNA processing endoribonuclease RAMP protein Cas6 [Fervidicoccus fontis]